MEATAEENLLRDGGRQESDLLTIYGFTFRFPGNCRLEFNPKFQRSLGDVAVKSPTKANVFVSWGTLEKIAKKAATTEEHADFSLQRVKKSAQGKFDGVEHSDVTVNGHQAIFNHVKVGMPKVGIFGGKVREQEIRSVHIHCENTSRYFVIYAAAYPETAEEQKRTFEQILETFRCHGERD